MGSILEFVSTLLLPVLKCNPSLEKTGRARIKCKPWTKPSCLIIDRTVLIVRLQNRPTRANVCSVHTSLCKHSVLQARPHVQEEDCSHGVRWRPNLNYSLIDRTETLDLSIKSELSSKTCSVNLVFMTSKRCNKHKYIFGKITLITCCKINFKPLRCTNVEMFAAQ